MRKNKEQSELLKEARTIAYIFSYVKSGVRIITLMKRKKEGGSTRTDRNAKKWISLNSKQFTKTLMKALSEWQEGYRIYCTLNSRDMEKGIRNFKQLMLDNEYQNQENKYYFYIDIWNRLISSLQRPSARKQKRFLIDIDDDDKNGLVFNDVLSKLEKIEMPNLATGYLSPIYYRTKNGYHIITEPFNYPKIMPELKKWDNIKTDGMVLLKY